MSGRNILLGTSTLAAASMLRMMIQALVMPVVGRFLGPEALGQLALVSPFVYFAMFFADSGLGASLIRAPSINRALEGSIFVFSLAITSVVIVFFAISGVPIGRMLHDSSFPPLLFAMSSILALAAFNVVPSSLLLREQRYHMLAISDTVSMAAGVLAIAAGLALGWGVWCLVAQQIAIWVSKLTMVCWASRWRPAFHFDWGVLRPHLGFGLNMTGSAVIAFLARNIDNVLIGAVLGHVVLGYYALAFQIVCLPQAILSGSIYFSVFSRVSEAERSGRPSAPIFLQVLKGTLLLAVPAMGGMAAVAPDAMPLLFGPKWEPAAPVLMLLAPYGLCQAIWPLLSGLMAGQGRARLTLGLSFVTGLVTIFAIAGSVSFGSQAVAAAVSGSAVISLGIGIVRLAKTSCLPLIAVGRCFLAPAVGLTTMCAGLFWVHPTIAALGNPWGSLLLQILFGAFLYGATIALLFRDEVSNEAALVRSLVFSRIAR